MVQFDPERNPVEVLADEFTRRCRRGECPSVAEYVQKYPDLADEIGELFPSIAMIEQLGRKEQTERDLAKSQTAFTTNRIERLGDFRILREIGRGGMGVVFEAEQQSLHRRVAVKVLSASTVSSPKQLRRFEREAKAAASLHHSNIVPVFGVGQQDGLHYYVMQFIEGVGLEVVISELKRSYAAAGADRSEADRRLDNGLAAAAAQALRDGRFVRARSAGSTAESPPSAPGSTVADADVTANNGGPPDRPDRARPCSGATPAGPQNRSDPTAELDSRTPDPERTGRCTNAEAGAESTGSPACLADPRARPTRQLGPRYWKSVAAIGVQLAEALHYAHGQGVLHRDIKPSNLLLDRQGVVWITDFGLAKDSNNENLTNSGDIVGTLKYMAPEQFRGRASEKTDIYSLGLTLHELLTLQSPFEETEPSDLIRRVTRGEPTRPCKRNPRIPRDLETIVLKAIAREPAHRYRSAGELAADLQRFLEDRPIQARPVAAVERLWRWCRRNPALAGSTAVAIVSLMLFAAAMCLGYVRTKDALVRESYQRQKAEATLEISLEALDKVYARFAPDRMATASQVTIEGTDGEDLQLTTQPVLSRETAALLEDILAFYDRFAEQNRDNARLRREAAKANRRVGDIHRRLGQYGQAEAAYRRAIQKYQALARKTNRANHFQLEIAGLHNDLGIVYQQKRDFERARAAHLTAMTMLKSAASTRAEPTEVRYELARTYYLLGKRPERAIGSRPRGRPPGPHVGRPDLLHEGRGPRPGAPPPPLDGRGPRHGRPGHRRGWPDAENYLNQAIELLKQLHQQRPGAPDYQHLLALCYRDSSPDFRSERVQSAIDILEQLSREFPSVADYRYDLSKTYAKGNFRDPRLTPEQRDLAEQRLRKALQYSDGLSAEHPNVPQYKESQIQIHHKLAYVLRRGAQEADEAARAARLDEAEGHYRRAIALQTFLIKRFPDASFYLVWKAKLQQLLAGLLRERGDLQQARSQLEEAIDSLRKVVVERPGSRIGPFILVESYCSLARVLEAAGEDEQAAEAARLAEQYRQRLRSGPPRRRGEGRGSSPDDRTGATAPDAAR